MIKVICTGKWAISARYYELRCETLHSLTVARLSTTPHHLLQVCSDTLCAVYHDNEQVCAKS